MSTPIVGPFSHPTEFDPAARRAELREPESGRFTKVLAQAVGDVNAMQLESEAKVAAFVRGEDVPLHEVVLAQEEAEISFRLLLEVRDQLVRAYQEIIRTPM